MHKKMQSKFTTRQRILEKDFEIYYYNDNHFTPTPRHDHTHYEFYFFYDGEIDMYIENQKFSLKQGNYLVIPPGLSHHAVTRNQNAPYRRFVLWISKQYFEKYFLSANTIFRIRSRTILGFLFTSIY